MIMERDEKNIFSEFEDEERKELIAEIIRQDPSLNTLPRAQFFALWFSDIRTLRNFAKFLEKDDPHFSWRSGILGDIHANDVPGIVAGGKQVNKSSDTMKKKCLERDNDRCILTKRDQPGLQCAHIVPFKLNGFSARDNTWRWLQLFWGQDLADKWIAELLCGSDQPNRLNTEQVKNLITLGSQEHNYWDNGMFAFRPVRTYQQHTKMDIAFHWLPPRGTEKQTDLIPTLSHPYPSQPQGYGRSPSGNRYLLHCETLNVLISGHIFTVTTANPVTHPLPSEKLLTMQWHLSRIASMQGAGEDEDSDLESDGDSVAVPSGSRSPAKEAHMF
ncbi:hypothetical protein N7527_009340 [Penicillium freii]|uniref:HNH nuclease domain-containing protein n=1 Tax=Penicillium freii TaxID=48697 RepID=A0A101M7R7_PENFR|nr:hypothetical protein N7527_009340 [Penicillium freii]KUM55472.1 hypothetical protein ACN42_g11799 [Penicillium freii]